jgi:hypothetical protein
MLSEKKQSRRTREGDMAVESLQRGKPVPGREARAFLG